MELMERIRVFKRTTDDWYGNYKITNDARVSDLVEVSVMQLSPWPMGGLTKWRVCVWGNDDCGLEIDILAHDEAMKIFYQVIGWDIVNKEKLVSIGFVYA